MSQPNPPPLPSLAFSPKTGVVLNGELLSKGFITPKKEKEAHFFRRRNQSSINEQLKCNYPNFLAVGILVGSRQNSEQWLRESGPGTSCLWAEIEDSSQNAGGKTLARQLKLIYRLRSEKSLNFLPVLDGVVVEISPPAGSHRDGGGLRKANSIKKTMIKGEVKRSGFTVQSEMQSPSNVSSCSTGDLSPSIDTSVGLVENEKSVGLVISEKAFLRLVLMISGGGIIREFQELLRRAVGSSNFLDVDYQLLDLQQWLKIHSFATFLEGNEIIVVRRGDGLSGLRWVVLRFDFCEGLLKSISGEDLNDLEQVLGNNRIRQVFGIRVSLWGTKGTSFGDKAPKTQMGELKSNLVWKMWTIPVENRDCQRGLLTQLLVDALGGEERLSVTEKTSFKSLFDSPAQICNHTQAEVRVIETVFALGRSKSISRKEQCALSHLRSSSKELKGRGFHVLLNLLLGVGSIKSPVTDPPLHGTSDKFCPRTSYSNSDSSLCPALGEQDTCLLGGDRQAELQEDDSRAKHGGEPLCIMDWLNCGFLEVLLERTTGKGGDKKVDGLETGRGLSIEAALETCLRVLELVPKEGSSQLAKLLVASLRETYEDLLKLNLNLKQNGNCDLDMQLRGCEGRPSSCANTMHASPGVQDKFEKVLRVCKLLSLLESQSPLVGGPFAESGGLDLILELYFCIVKRFPTNLRFGVLSNAARICKSSEQNLPGEAIKSHDGPLKVLPCILPCACISGVAHACLMDDCMSPKAEEVDSSWPPTSSWKVLYHFKDPVDSLYDVTDRSYYDFPFDCGLGAQFGPTCDSDLLPKLPSGIESQKHFLSTTSLSSCNTSGIATPRANGCSPPSAINYSNNSDARVEGPAIFHKIKQTRPFVPRLPLSSLRRSTSRFGPSKVESQEARASQTPSAEPSLCQVSSHTRASTAQFDILTVVFNVKCELLQIMIQLFSNRSPSLNASRSKLLQKFQKEDADYLALQFLPDIISSFLKLVPNNLSKKTKKMLFEVISLLDRGKIPDSMKKAPSSANGRTDEEPVKRYKIDQGVPFSNSKRLMERLLLEIGERLRTLLHHLANMVATCESSTGETTVNRKQLCVPMGAHAFCDPLLENHNISSGHLLNLWVDIGLLLRALVDFVVLWPEGGSVDCILNSCGKELEIVMRLLAEISSKNKWSLAQILTMEHLLKLLTVCVKNSVVEKSSEFQAWSSIDSFLWQLLILNDLHWNCIKNFVTWVIMKSCQGCFRKLFESYQRVLYEPLEIYYNIFGERINHKPAEPSECTLHGVEMLKSIFSFLRVIILMMKKRLKYHGQTNPSCPQLFMERLVFLLDFLMNPVEGILMKVIRSPVPCFKMNVTQKEIEALNVLTSTKPPESTGEHHVHNNHESLRPTIDENLFSHHLQESCRKCPSTPCAASCAHKFTSYLKKESLGILADIFSLRPLDHDDELTSVIPRRQNPFLFRKYVNPFLEIIFFYFLKYYNKKCVSNESSKISPFTRRISGTQSPTSANSGQQFSGYTGTREGSSMHETNFYRNDEDGVLCSDCVQDDKVSSVACVSYGQVLRALAQNQTEDVNQSFQQIRVMKFLVQQIGLEYEMSQVVTPREVALPIQEITTELSLQELHCENSTAGLLFMDERAGANFSHNSEDTDPPKIIVEEKDEKGHGAVVTHRTAGILPVAKELIVSELFFSKGCSTSLKNLHDAKTLLGQNELAVDTDMLLGQRSNGNLFDKGNLKELEVSKKQASSQSDSEISAQSNRTLEENNARITSPSDQSRTTAANDYGNAIAHSRLEKIGDDQDFCQNLGRDREELSVDSIPTKLKYAGRFFDLNEEVEKELAQEDFSCAEGYSQEIDRTTQTTDFDVLEDILEESSLQECGLKFVAFDPTKSRIGRSSKFSSAASFPEVKFGITPKQNPRHPPIPRLNLSKSVRKGGPVFKSDTSVDFEFLPSPSSTSDSMSRPNAILELQRELQKEVLSSDRSGKSWEIGTSYESGCLQRRLYRHAGLHVLLLELFVSLMLTPQGTLETSYSDRYPMENRKLNAPFFLFYHLNHAANVYLLPCLSKRMKDFNPAAVRILKLTWRALFNPKIYTNRDHIARGAASQVYTAKVKRNSGESDGVTDELVVLKVVDVPKGPYDPCKFFDVYSEVEILEKFSGEPAICQILDYGVDTESFILVLKHYKCSLYTWRQGQRANSGSGRFSPTELEGAGVVPKFVIERLPLYLEVYSAILQAVKKLEIENVVHYDLKCDNILLEPLDSSCLESEFWTLRWPPVDPSKPLPFRVCIADFGQSKASTHLGGECTVRNRGTEYVKSPEMLKLLSSQSQRETDFNMRTTDEGVGKAVDVWSLGCLLYELLTGEYLFYDEDWLQFFMRVTLPSEELISKEKAAKLENYGPVVDLLKFILVRDPLQRPSLDEVTICVEQLQLKLEAQPLTTTSSADDVATKFQTLSESGSDTDESNSHEQMLSNEIYSARDRLEPNDDLIEYNIPDRLKEKIHVDNCLERLRGLCCCQCGEGS